MLRRVVVVDDATDVRRAVAEMVRRPELEVTAFASADAALAAIAAVATSLVITDVDMPFMTGIALVEAMQARGLEIPVVLISGRPRDEIRERARHLRLVRGILTKPFRLATIRQVVAVEVGLDGSPRGAAASPGLDRGPR